LRLAKPAIRGFKEDMHYMIYIYIYGYHGGDDAGFEMG
jgi:hypothetical protein